MRSLTTREKEEVAPLRGGPQGQGRSLGATNVSPVPLQLNRVSGLSARAAHQA